MSEETGDKAWVELDPVQPVWERFFLVSPLVVVGTREGEGFDLAPKHMAFPLGWENYFGFVCTPRHATYHNARESGAFTVSYPRPDQLVVTSLTAQRRDAEGSVPALDLLPTESARVVEGIFLRDAYVQLECELEKVVDGFGPNSLIAGRIVAARVRSDALRTSDRGDTEQIRNAPLLAYLHPGRFAEISETRVFPFPADFSR
ncbi:MAG: flavin reductase [Gemmatimonadales bacterium]|nr:MAG: flavin reductase [Gemmatimonadales bacterium]